MPPVAGFHLHLYQPPREDPWLGLYLNEWGAWPYRDWNERITSESYRSLLEVPVPGEGGRDVLVEPLAASSLDVGPTLHDWLERRAPDVDRALARQLGAHEGGARSLAMAAPLVHAILPLADPKDRDRLVAWGIADYVRRFGEAPLGMWLPETAVDLVTLEILARRGIRYTILMAPQAARVRLAGGEWTAVDEATLDTSRPYRVRLRDGGHIVVVFGHQRLSQAVAFGEALRDGSKLADDMVEALGGRDGAVILVADGETYGHHHRFGDLGLAWALRRLQRDHGLATALGDWLATQRPLDEVELPAASAWSCAHGVERWRGDCGCVTGGERGWRQAWRRPLRDSLDWLRAELGARADAALSRLVGSVDDALADYGRVLARSIEPRAFVAAHARGPLDDEGTSAVLELCEIHRHLLYGFTSCAWFFAEPDEIETHIVLRYAARALEIGRRALGADLEPAFVERLARVRSNRPGVDGATIWRRACDPWRRDEPVIAAGFAAEHLAGALAARSRRGAWRAEVSATPGEASVRVALESTATLRRREFDARVERVGALGVRVFVREGEHAWTVGLDELGDDVVARLGAAWLVGSGSDDFEAALDLLAVRVFEAPLGPDEATALLALAGSLRYVTPLAQASIRRVLRAMFEAPVGRADLARLRSLARAAGLEDLVTMSGAGDQED
jgi:Domain of unknown function (DUF3536)/Glycosyl hydrolase family 57